MTNAWNTDGPLAKTKVLVVTRHHAKTCLPFIPLLDGDEIVYTPQVQFGKEPGPAELFDDRRHQRERVTVFGGDIIKPSGIHTQA